MKIGDRDTPGTRICAEREFKESCQVLVATEAAGEGINLQFCHLMINYDLPWNPAVLEQRIGRLETYREHFPSESAASARWSRCSASDSAIGSTTRRTTCRAASANAWPWLALSSRIRRSCSPTSRPATSIRSQPAP